MKNWQFGAIILCLLGLFSVLFINNKNTQKQNIFEKNIMCKNLYSSQSASLKDGYVFSYDGIERWVSDIETFYSKEFDTCAVVYQIHYRDDKNDADNDDNYIIETIKEADDHYGLVMACHSKIDKDCFSKRDKKRLELK